MQKIPNTNLTLSKEEIQAVVDYYLKRDNVINCSIKIDFNGLNQSLSKSNLWNKPVDKIIPSIMEENFKTLGINYAK